MRSGPDLDALAAALADLPGYSRVDRADLSVLTVKGLAHDHVAIRGRPHLLRVPKQSQFALSAADNLAYQAACFARVAPCGHGPRLHGIIAPAPGVPMGALVVQRIRGRPPRLPEDLPALATALAAAHSLPVPGPAARPPLADHADPVGGAMAEIEAQARFMVEADVPPAARAEVADELAWARAFQDRARMQTQPVTLVLTDTHPGNFLIQADGRAVIVDLERRCTDRRPPIWRTRHSIPPPPGIRSPGPIWARRRWPAFTGTTWTRPPRNWQRPCARG